MHQLQYWLSVVLPTSFCKWARVIELVFRLLFLCHLNSFTLFLSSSSSSLLLFSHVFPASSQWLHLSMSLCVFLHLLRVAWALCWCEGSSAAWALGSRWSALYHSQTDSCLSLQGSCWGTEEDRDRERLKRGSFSISLSPSHTFSLKWSTHYHMYVLR